MRKKITRSTLDFIQELQQNNQRDWFQANKERYEAAKQDFLEFLDNLLAEASIFEPVLKDQKGKDTTYRIYRDVRFSANKTPYKDHFCAFMAKGGKKSTNPGYYLHINPNNQSFLACGLWSPLPAELKVIRQEIDYNYDELKGIVEKPVFKKAYGSLKGETLKTNPKGYDSENPAISWLRHKNWNVIHNLSDELLLSDRFTDTVLELMRTAKPLVDFFLRPLQDLAENNDQKKK